MATHVHLQAEVKGDGYTCALAGSQIMYASMQCLLSGAGLAVLRHPLHVEPHLYNICCYGCSMKFSINAVCKPRRSAC
jgi:hypothetical protein